MAMGKRKVAQAPMWIPTSDLPTRAALAPGRAPGEGRGRQEWASARALAVHEGRAGDIGRRNSDEVESVCNGW